MKHFCAALSAALYLLWPFAFAQAETVTLISETGSLSLSGRFLGFDGQFYRIDTEHGELTVDGASVTCTGTDCPDPDLFVADVSISGSATIGQVLLPALVEAFALRAGFATERVVEDETHFRYKLSERGSGRPIANFRFRVTNTDEGFADLLANEADLVMSLREIRTSEADLAIEVGLGDLRNPNRSRVVALDALVPVVAAGNPVQTVSLQNLSDVLNGEVTNWAQLGGNDAPITLHLRDSESGITQAALDLLLTDSDISLKAKVVSHPTNKALDRAVAEDMFGLGIASFASIAQARELTLMGTCGFHQIATRRSIKTEDYPLMAPMFLYQPARRLPKIARDFLRFTRSDPAQIVIRRAGFVDQEPEQVPIGMQGLRFANGITVAQGATGLATLKRMVSTFAEMARLSTSFRFETGAARLDAQSTSNVQQLARAIESGDYKGRRLIFVGFSDGQGDADANLAIARQRAETVRRAVIEAVDPNLPNGPEIGVDAFGEALPMACDDTVLGRRVNRRVEVWVQ